MSQTFDNNNQTPSMDQFLIEMNKKVEELLKQFFVSKTFDGKPWAEEMFEVTMQVIVDVTVANTDVSNFDINTSIQDHMLFMNVQDNQGNTVADVLYFVTYNGDATNPASYKVDDVQVAFKLGAFVASKEEQEVVEDSLPFD